MDLKLSNKRNTLVIHVMQNQTEDLFFLYLVFCGNYLVSAIILLLPLKEFSCSCVHVSCLFSHVFLTAQEKGVETQRMSMWKMSNEQVKAKKCLREDRDRAEVIVGTETLLPSTGWQQNWNRKEWTCLICALYMWCALSLFWSFTD